MIIQTTRRLLFVHDHLEFKTDGKNQPQEAPDWIVNDDYFGMAQAGKVLKVVGNVPERDPDVLTQAEIDELKPEDILVIDPTLEEKINNAGSPEEVSALIQEAKDSRDLELNSALLKESQTPVESKSAETPVEDESPAEELKQEKPASKPKKASKKE